MDASLPSAAGCETRCLPLQDYEVACESPPGKEPIPANEFEIVQSVTEHHPVLFSPVPIESTLKVIGVNGAPFVKNPEIIQSALARRKVVRSVREDSMKA